MKKVGLLLKKLFKWMLYTALFLAVGGGVTVWLFSDQIQQQIIKHLNTQLNTPVKVAVIDANLWDNFPFLTIAMDKVEITESIEFSDQHLLWAQEVELIFNPFTLLQGDYTVNRIRITDGDLRVTSDRKGRKNYIIFKQNEANPQSGSYFNIDRVYLENVSFQYLDEVLRQDITLLATRMEAGIDKSDSLYRISWSGDKEVYAIQLGEQSYLDGRKVWSEGSLTYDDRRYAVRILSGDVRFREAEFLISGDYLMGDRGKIDLQLEGKETDIQNLLSLLPEKSYESLSHYKSSGAVYFDLELTGYLNADESPGISIHFGTREATVTHPDTGMALENLSMEGWYVSNSLEDLRNAELSLKDIRAVFDGRPLTGSLLIRNFEDKFLQFDLVSQLNLPSLLRFYPQESITSSKGTLDVDVSFAGRLNDLKNKSTMSRISSSGEIGFQGVSVSMKGVGLPLQELNGTMLFNNENIAMNELSARIGRSDFLLDGMLGNIFSYVLLDRDRIVVDAALQSEFMDLDELLSLQVVNGNRAEPGYSLEISPGLFINFDCHVDRLSFRRFSGTNISGVLKVRDQLAMLQNIRFREAGGSVNLEGLVDTRTDQVEVMTRFVMDDIYLDSMFYVFEDFNQDWLVYRHLSGRMDAEVTAFMNFTPDLRLIPESLVSDLSLTILDGKLNNFEPMQLLAPYFPKDDLSRLEFAELRNEIHVEDEMIYIPQMKISSNVTEIEIGGTHTFDQHIDYKIVAPLFHAPRVDRDELFAAIEDDGSTSPKIHLRLTGTTDEYEVKLDRAGQKEQVISGLRKEVDELKKAFRDKRKQKQKTLQLDEEEYFDWNDNG